MNHQNRNNANTTHGARGWPGGPVRRSAQTETVWDAAHAPAAMAPAPHARRAASPGRPRHSALGAGPDANAARAPQAARGAAAWRALAQHTRPHDRAPAPPWPRRRAAARRRHHICGAGRKTWCYHPAGARRAAGMAAAGAARAGAGRAHPAMAAGRRTHLCTGTACPARSPAALMRPVLCKRTWRRCRKIAKAQVVAAAGCDSRG